VLTEVRYLQVQGIPAQTVLYVKVFFLVRTDVGFFTLHISYLFVTIRVNEQL